MTSLKSAALAVVFAIASACGATASSLPGVTDSYVGTYNVENGFADTHGLWFRDLFEGTDAGDSKEWTSTGGTFTYDGTNVTITGSVQNNGNSDLTLDYSFSLVQIADGGRDPACGRVGCRLAADGGPATQLEYDNVLFFDYVSASVSGSGILDGLLLDLSIKPADLTKPFQFGYCANWFDCDFGASSWFDYTVVRQASIYDLTRFVTPPKYWAKAGNGDININLTPVPLPAAAWLLIGGMGALGALRARRKPA